MENSLKNMIIEICNDCENCIIEPEKIICIEDIKIGDIKFNAGDITQLDLLQIRSFDIKKYFKLLREYRNDKINDILN